MKDRECNNTKKQLLISCMSKLAGKKLWYSYVIKWSDGKKEQDRQDEEAAVVTATHKRKMLCKT